MTDRRGSEPPRKRGRQSGRATRPARLRPVRPPLRTAAAPPRQRPESTRERLLRQAREEQAAGAPAAAAQRRPVTKAAPQREPGEATCYWRGRRRVGKRLRGRRPKRPRPRRVRRHAKRPPQNSRPRPRPKKRKVRKPPRMLRLGRPALRLRVTFGVMAFVLSLFAGRLVLLQGVDPDSYAPAADEGEHPAVRPARVPRHDHRPQRRTRWPCPRTRSRSPPTRPRQAGRRAARRDAGAEARPVRRTPSCSPR